MRKSHVNTKLVNINSVTQSKSVQTYSYFAAKKLSFLFALSVSFAEYEKLNSRELFQVTELREMKRISAGNVRNVWEKRRGERKKTHTQMKETKTKQTSERVEESLQPLVCHRQKMLHKIK